jgi:UDP-N-acetylglucosamine/UDP-N-acetylgalactosamine diphosphorylase
MPAIDQNGLLILEKPYKIFKNPNGHGGVFKALKKSGISNKLKAVGIKHIFYFQIDNPLVKVADPAFIGYHIIRKAEISTKIVAKVNPEEKVGVVARMDGRLGIVEYSDLSQELMRQRDNQGLLLLRGGNIAVHCIEVDFAEKITEEGNNLPFHKAQKKIKIFDREAQGIKFETFIFDALGYAENSVTMEVKREEEFAPVKNFSGTDSPESARSMMSEYCCRWLEQAGISIPRTRDGYSLVKVEISPLYACDLNDFLHKFRGCFELNPGVEIYLSRSLDSLKADA